METAPRPKKFIEADFKPEGYVSDGSMEYFEQLSAALEKLGYDPKNLIYSGFDGTPLKHGWPPSKHPTIFGMNHTGWLRAARGTDNNPAEYALNWPIPCIGLYDRSQLAEAYTYDLPEDLEEDSRLDLANIKRGRNLDEIDTDEALEEAFIHKDYPNKTPDDALLGVIYLHD